VAPDRADELVRSSPADVLDPVLGAAPLFVGAVPVLAPGKRSPTSTSSHPGSVCAPFICPLVRPPSQVCSDLLEAIIIV
jgi:hypothetical protein